MILHVRFSDGSNPWQSLPADRHTIARHWRRWAKYHPNNAVCLAWCGSWLCVWDSRVECYVVGDVTRADSTTRHYKNLGHALAALERLGEG